MLIVFCVNIIQKNLETKEKKKEKKKRKKKKSFTAAAMATFETPRIIPTPHNLQSLLAASMWLLLSFKHFSCTSVSLLHLQLPSSVAQCGICRVNTPNDTLSNFACLPCC